MHNWLQIWLGFINDPVGTFEREKKHSNYKDALLHYAIAGLVIGVLFTIFSYSGNVPEGYDYLTAFNLPPVANAILLALLRSTLIAVFLYLFILLLDGRGAFVTHYYLLSLASIPVSVIDFFLGFFTSIEGLIVRLAFSSFKLYLFAIALQEAHELGEHESFLSWFIPLVLLLLGVIFVAQFFSGGNALEFFEKYLV